MIYLFCHDARNLASSVVRSRKALSIERTWLLLGELEPDILLIDWWTHGAIRTTPSPGTAPKHEAGSQLGTTRRSQHLALILVSESSESWGSKALREGAAVVVLLLLAEAGVTLNVAVVIGSRTIFSVLHHDTQVGRIVSDRIVVIGSTNRGSLAMPSLVVRLCETRPSLHARLEDGGVGRERGNDLCWLDRGRLNCRRGSLEVSDNTLKRRQGITSLGTCRRSGSARV